MVLRALLPVVAAGALHAQALISLGASSGSGTGCSLGNGGTCTLTARVTGITPATVRFTFIPAVDGATVGAPIGPDATGLTTITYRAPSTVLVRQTVTVTATAIGDDTKTASQQITLAPPAPAITIGSGAPTPALQSAF